RWTRGHPRNPRPPRLRRGPAARLSFPQSRSASGGRPRMRVRFAAPEDRELIGAHLLPCPGAAARPGHANIGGRRVADPDMDPSELAAGVSAADRELASHDPPTHA